MKGFISESYVYVRFEKDDKLISKVTIDSLINEKRTYELFTTEFNYKPIKFSEEKINGEVKKISTTMFGKWEECKIVHLDQTSKLNSIIFNLIESYGSVSFSLKQEELKVGPDTNFNFYDVKQSFDEPVTVKASLLAKNNVSGMYNLTLEDLITTSVQVASNIEIKLDQPIQLYGFKTKAEYIIVNNICVHKNT